MATYYYRLRCSTEGLDKDGFVFPALTSTDINTPPAAVCPTNGGHTVAADSLTLVGSTGGEEITDQTIIGTSDISNGTLLLPQGTGTAPTASGSAFFKTDTTTISVGDGSAARAVVDTTGTQTLTNKTLTTPTIASFTNAGHTHVNAAGGGQLDHTTALTNIGTNSHTTIDSHIGATTAHGATGAVVGTTNTQTLTGKTLTIPTIADFTNASHSHTTAASGGQLDHTTALTNIGTNSHATIDTHIAATTAHGATGAVVGTTNTQTLTNKTLTTPTIGDFTNSVHTHTTTASGGQLDHTTALTNIGTNSHATIDSHIASTTAHGATGANVGTTNTQTLTNKSLSDSTTAVVDVTDSTKQIKFDAAGTTGTSTTLLSSQTTNKTLTLPDVTDTLVGKTTTDTLTNKTLTTPTIGDFTNATHAHTAASSGGTIAYGSLTSRSHTLADTSGLGADHTTSGLTSGQLLTATGATTAVFQARAFTINAVFLSPSATQDVVVWKAPFACTVTAVRGYRNAGTSASITAGSSPAGSITITNFTTAISLTDSNNGTWDQTTGLSVAVAANTNVWVRITAISGTATQITIQADLTRP